MANKKKSGRASSRLLGTFTLPGGRELFGALRLARGKTSLTLHGDESFDEVRGATRITGMTVDGECVTLLDCSSPGVGYASKPDGQYIYNANVFPHFVVIGRAHLDPSAATIASVAFQTPDMVPLFYDFDAFGTLLNPAAEVMDIVLSEARARRPVSTGKFPWVGYFTGQLDIVEVSTVIGKVVVGHRPQFSVGGPRGAFINGRMQAELVFGAPLDFPTAYGRAHDLLLFLGMAAGRRQATQRMHIMLASSSPEGAPHRVTVVTSLSSRPSTHGEYKPHPRDVPLDPVRRKAEFETVLRHWTSRHDAWRDARSRYIGCLSKENKFGVDRLVAAANMFDILPDDAGLPSVDLAPSMAATRDACMAMLRKEAVSLDRDSALSSLGRMGRPSLPKKVAHRASLVEAQFGESFRELQLVCSVAVKVRNFFVHGSSGDIEMPKVEPFLAFLTNALEFVFGASDFIEAGWDPARWEGGGGWGHNFTRFKGEYPLAIAELKVALAK